MRKTGLIKNCLVCKKKFYVPGWEVKQRKYCSSKCYGKTLKDGKLSYRLGKYLKGVFGEDNWNWKGGVTPINEKLRKSLEYKLWRKAVFERDNYICVWCGYKGNKLQADHIKPFSLYPELRFAIDNGRTLCIECHRKTDTWGGATKFRRLAS